MFSAQTLRVDLLSQDINLSFQFLPAYCLPGGFLSFLLCLLFQLLDLFFQFFVFIFRLFETSGMLLQLLSHVVNIFFQGSQLAALLLHLATEKSRLQTL